jgi:hypothetical protein
MNGCTSPHGVVSPVGDALAVALPICSPVICLHYSSPFPIHNPFSIPYQIEQHRRLARLCRPQYRGIKSELLAWVLNTELRCAGLQFQLTSTEYTSTLRPDGGHVEDITDGCQLQSALEM